MYKVSFTDENGQEFMGTTNHFATDGRYSLATIDQVARDTASKLIDHNAIKGYVVRRERFTSPVIATVSI